MEGELWGAGLGSGLQAIGPGDRRDDQNDSLGCLLDLPHQRVPVPAWSWWGPWDKNDLQLLEPMVGRGEWRGCPAQVSCALVPVPTAVGVGTRSLPTHTHETVHERGADSKTPVLGCSSRCCQRPRPWVRH